ncbi:insulinase family protein [Streptomyces sp. SHP22-7]|nr:insulinase family protein [Streptomyces sp. SHP22-7]
MRSENAIVAEEIRASDAGTRLWDTVLAALHPGARDAYGTVAELREMTPDEAEAFFRRHYRPERAVLSVAGDVDAGRTAELVEREFGGWTPPPVPCPADRTAPGPSPAPASASPSPSPSLSVPSSPSPSARPHGVTPRHEAPVPYHRDGVAIGHALADPRRDRGTYFAQAVLCEVLRRSRLPGLLTRTARLDAATVRCGYQGQWLASAAPDLALVLLGRAPGTGTDEAVGLWRDTLAELASEPPGQEELRPALAVLRAACHRQADSLTARAVTHGRAALLFPGLDGTGPDTIPEHLAAVTAPRCRPPRAPCSPHPAPSGPWRGPPHEGHDRPAPPGTDRPGDPAHGPAQRPGHRRRHRAGRAPGRAAPGPAVRPHRTRPRRRPGTARHRARHRLDHPRPAVRGRSGGRTRRRAEHRGHRRAPGLVGRCAGGRAADRAGTPGRPAAAPRLRPAGRRRHPAAPAPPGPGARLRRAQLRHAFGGPHPLSDDAPGGTVPTAAELLALHHRAVVPRGAVLLLMTGEEPDRVLDRVHAELGAWTGGPSGLSLPPFPRSAPAPGRLALHDPAAEQALLLTAGPAVPAPGPGHPALHLAQLVLGGHASSRLTRRLRERHGLAYAVDARIRQNRAGCWLEIDCAGAPAPPTGWPRRSPPASRNWPRPVPPPRRPDGPGATPPASPGSPSPRARRRRARWRASRRPASTRTG